LGRNINITEPIPDNDEAPEHCDYETKHFIYLFFGDDGPRRGVAKSWGLSMA
jgi:hypothetical protein